jgi:hypothetical protein
LYLEKEVVVRNHHLALPTEEILVPEQEVKMAGWFHPPTGRVLGGDSSLTCCSS